MTKCFLMAKVKFVFSLPNKNASGFSLLEMLVALSLLSLISLALFQSTTLLLQTSNKAANVGERIFDEFIALQTYQDLVANLIPAWDQQPDEVFKGSTESFSGLSAGVPTWEGQRIAAFTLRFENPETGGKVLLLDSDKGSFPIITLPQGRFAFHYLGADRQWYEAWPPETVPSPGFFDDAKYMTVPQLPLAIRLQDVSDSPNSQDVAFYWLGVHTAAADLPFRDENNQDDEL